jgi:hypothetical protein
MAIMCTAIRKKGSAKETLTGKWKLDRTIYGQVVELNNFHAFPRESSPGKGYYLLEPTQFLGSIGLIRTPI